MRSTIIRGFLCAMLALAAAAEAGPFLTTTTLPDGACCKPGGTCAEETAAECDDGIFQGAGTLCELVECPQPTTTSTSSTYYPSSTSSTTLGTVICGDANNDLDVTSSDALIALRTAVGLQSCPLIRCDFNGTGLVTAPDALGILKYAVGQVVVPMCPVPLTP